MQPVGVDGATFSALLDRPTPPTIDDPTFPDGWVLDRRSDDWCTIAYFYLDSPTDTLPPLQPLSERLAP